MLKGRILRLDSREEGPEDRRCLSLITPNNSELNTTIIWEVSNMKKNVIFGDYLTEQFKNPEFKAGFDAESAKLESDVVLMKERERS